MLQFFKTPGFWAGAIIFVFFVVSILQLRYPGIHYDEVLFTNAALRVDHTSFVTAHVWRLPLLLMPYIGALKSYFFVPVFWLFGSSVITIRSINILAMCVFLWLVYRLVRVYASERSALISLALLASNASIIIFGRTDFGPVIIEHLVFALSTVLFFSFTKNGQLRQLILALVCLAVGLFNKLNFLWFINAFYFSGVFIYFSAWSSLKNKALRFKILAISGAAYISYLAYYLLISRYYNVGRGFRLGQLRYMVDAAAQTLGGQWFFRGLLGSSISPIYSYVLCSLGAGLIVYALFWFIRNKKSPINKLFLFCLLVMAALLGQIAVTPDATAGWHYLTLEPFWAIAVAIAISTIAAEHVRKDRLAAYAAALTLCFCQLSLYLTNIRLLQHHKNIVWSEAIYDLAIFTHNTAGQYIVADWGIQTQLLTLDPRSNTFVEAFGPIDLSNPQQVAAAKHNFFEPTASPAGQYIITHPNGKEVLPKSQTSILAIANTLGKVERVAEITDEGQPVFEIYQLNPSYQQP